MPNVDAIPKIPSIKLHLLSIIATIIISLLAKSI